MIDVIFHIDELSKWNLLLKNVQNLINALDNENFHIEVLANSEAVKFYLGSSSDSDYHLLADLTGLGVQFTACNNALEGFGIQHEQLPRFVLVVPAGVLELIEKQHQGYAYIKP